MKMRRRICLLLSLIIAVLSLASCGNGDQGSQRATQGTTATTATEGGQAVQAIADPSHYFDDAAFVGDSVSLMLDIYATRLRDSGEECLGKATFLTAGSMGWNSSLWDISKGGPMPTLFGEAVRIEDGLQQIGAKKVYIMLGMNDLSKDDQTNIDAISQVIAKINEKNPGIKIYIQSVTPVTQAKEGDVTLASINEFNKILKSFCAENNYRYLDVAAVMQDDNGYLREEYCGDPDGMGIHFNNIASEIWVEFLKNNL